MKSIEDFTGCSEFGINDAIQNALQQTTQPARIEVLEMLGSQDNQTKRHYQVTLRAITE